MCRLLNRQRQMAARLTRGETLLMLRPAAGWRESDGEGRAEKTVGAALIGQELVLINTRANTVIFNQNDSRQTSV